MNELTDEVHKLIFHQSQAKTICDTIEVLLVGYNPFHDLIHRHAMRYRTISENWMIN